MSKSNSDELEKRVHALFGDSQVYDGGYHSCYDGKWIDMTNEVVAVAELIEAEYAKREQLLLSGLVKKAVYYTADKLEADGLDKWAVPVSFINAKRGNK